MFQHILYATDFSDAATQAGPYASALARSFGSEIDVLHVVSKDASENRDLLIAKERESLTGPDGTGCEHDGVPHGVRTFIETGKPRERILEHAREIGADLIVLGAHRHSRLAMHLRIGPAFRIVIEASCPVLTVCSPEPQPSVPGQPTGLDSAFSHTSPRAGTW